MTTQKSLMMTKRQLVLDVLRDPERKSLLRIFLEFIYLYFYYREFPRQYLSCYLFKKDKKNIRDYLPWKYLYGIKEFFIEKEVREVLENKLFFDFYYRPFGVSLPEIIMSNYRDVFALRGKTRKVSNVEEFKTLLEEIFNEHPDSDSMIIKKAYWSYGGDKVFKIFKDQVRDDHNLMTELYSTVIKTGYLFQEVVVQHSEMNKLNPSCLNTLRIDTFINPDGQIEIISAYLRMSFRNSFVDNITSGGLQVGVDKNTGLLKKEGFSVFRNVGAKTFTAHPVTSTVFENFKIPYFEEARELVVKVAGLMPGLRLVGWDVAISETGPVLIEGNSDYDNTGNNLSEGGFLTNPVFRKILAEYWDLRKLKTKSGRGHLQSRLSSFKKAAEPEVVCLTT